MERILVIAIASTLALGTAMAVPTSLLSNRKQPAPILAAPSPAPSDVATASPTPTPTPELSATPSSTPPSPSPTPTMAPPCRRDEVRADPPRGPLTFRRGDVIVITVTETNISRHDCAVPTHLEERWETADGTPVCLATIDADPVYTTDPKNPSRLLPVWNPGETRQVSVRWGQTHCFGEDKFKQVPAGNYRLIAKVADGVVSVTVPFTIAE